MYFMNPKGLKRGRRVDYRGPRSFMETRQFPNYSK